MTNLTEQWKKGELPCGWYYIKIADIVFIDFFEGKVWKNKKDEYIDEVLAEVLSYEEYINCKDCLKLVWEAAQKEVKLKELLKECVEYVKKDYGDYLTYTQSAIYQEISEVLGED